MEKLKILDSLEFDSVFFDTKRKDEKLEKAGAEIEANNTEVGEKGTSTSVEDRFSRN